MNMNMVARKVVDFIKEEEGLTTVEYAIAGALISAGIVAAFTNLGCEIAETITWMGDIIGGNANAVRAGQC